MVILINSVFGTGRNYYPQVLLEECKYIVKKTKMPNYWRHRNLFWFWQRKFWWRNFKWIKFWRRKCWWKKFKKTNKIFKIFFSIYKKMTTKYNKNKKKSFQKRLLKCTKIFLKKNKIKSTNILMSYIEIFLHKKKKRSISIVKDT